MLVSYYPALQGGATGMNVNPTTDAENSTSTEGLVIIWNRHLPLRPERVFHAPTPIVSALFATHHPQLVVGGGHSGQVFVWDLRHPNRHPSLQTSLGSCQAHAHPILGLHVVGVPSSHSLISLSSDGRMCAWSLDQLSQPQEVLALVHPAGVNTPLYGEEVMVSCAAIVPGETSTLWVGDEGGFLYRVHRYDQAARKAGVQPQLLAGGHDALITGIHFHPHDRYQHLFLSSSADWTVRLWDSSEFGAKSSVSPKAVFEHAHGYVLEARWSPVHPGVFASVDAGGHVSLFNLAVDMSVCAV
jgi:dynein intermediate chain, cytosolic